MAVANVPVDEISDWESFHRVVAKSLRFPPYYGRNGNAFIDCLRDIVDGRDVPRTLSAGETLSIDLGSISTFRGRCPEQLEALIDWIGW